LDSCQTTPAKLKFGRHNPSILPVKTMLTDYYRHSDNYLVPFRGLELSEAAKEIIYLKNYRFKNNWAGEVY